MVSILNQITMAKKHKVLKGYLVHEDGTEYTDKENFIVNLQCIAWLVGFIVLIALSVWAH
jgi:hypothetical protein